ncbi:TSC22 domain family protein 1-like [Caenorhabditis elegans]|uniref:TSC22 domain family protein 1-like n=2 Tax=Caenorhabditis elegans TaxID=6239 RepID=Q65ZH8_CAEEL|nr:TSC22 domain family protein 1-like [Caenorhabditis elegans]CCD63631.2 TSC22 domain family protein 1-like [Caenorhabditis elegans]|eukprot:NP_001024437.2 Uncharacterized protein CELE_C30G4.4 [Caenorhabditis elegans]
MAALFNESLRKVNEQQPPTIIEEDETPKRANRPPDLQGFSILDEKWRSSCSDDSDDSLPVGSYISTAEKPLRFCKSVDFRPLRREAPNLTGDSCSTLPSTPVHKKNPPLPTMSSGGSRFKQSESPINMLITHREMKCDMKSEPSLKVVPVETRDPYFSPNGKHAIAKPTAAIKNIHPSSSPSVVQPTSGIPVQQRPASHLIAPNPKPVYTVPKVAPTAQVKASTIIQPTVNGQVKVSSETQISTGVMVAEANQSRRTKRAPLVRAKTVVAASPPAHNVLNIDNKIEQAMDLVKTHLMFAVREEVDGLRGKIFDLENHVRRLEAENSILKRTIPNDTLKQLHLKL